MRPLFFCLIFLAAVGWIISQSQSFQSCIQPYQQQRGAQNSQKSHSQILIAARPYEICLGNFIHDEAEAIIAAFTIIVAIATIFLWSATRDLVRGAKAVSETQLRAFVFAKGFSQGPNVFLDKGPPYIKEWVFWYDIENVGLTPATDVKAWIKSMILPISKNGEPNFEWTGEGNTAIIGPKGTGKSGFCPVPLQAMVDLWERKVEIYLAGRVEYRDTFNPRVVHHHEMCVMLDLTRHPADVESPETKNSPRVIIRVYGKQNSVA